MKKSPLAALAFSALALLVPPLRSADAIPPPEHPPQVLANTQLRTLPRSANGRDYLLYVALPPDYDADRTKRYPVVHCTDGYWDFVLMNGFYGNVTYDKAAPPYITR